MSPAKLSAIRPHIQTISRISRSTAVLQAHNIIRAGGPIGNDRYVDGVMIPSSDDEQEVPVPGFESDQENGPEESLETQTDGQEESTASRGPTQHDSSSDDDEPPQQPPSNKTPASIKGDTKRDASGKKTRQKTAPNKDKQVKNPPKTTKSDEQVDVPASIAFSYDDEDAKVHAKVEQNTAEAEEKPKKSSRPKKPSLDEAAPPAPKRSNKPSLAATNAPKRRSTRPEFTDIIDGATFANYRTAIMRLTDTVKTPTAKNQYKTADKFNQQLQSFGTKMKRTAKDGFSKHNIRIIQGQLRYIVSKEEVMIENSVLDKADPKTLFKQPSLVKKFTVDQITQFLSGQFIDTVNVLAFDVKQLSLLDYDKITGFSFYNDVHLPAPEEFTFNMPAYIKLISNIHKYSFADVFDARSNWMYAIPDVDRESKWDSAVERFDAFSRSKHGINQNVMAIMDKIIHSKYVKRYIMYGYAPNPIFAKVFHAFLTEETFKDDLLKLFEGPLEDIAFNFTPICFSYRGVTYNPPEGSPTFNDLVRCTDDPGVYDPSTNAWIGTLQPDQ